MEFIPGLKFCLALLCVAALPAVAQEGHGIGPADLQRGALIYLNNCASCHGPDGDGVPGVNLGGNRFRRAKTDAELMAIVQKGIPGTPMPPGNYTDDQAAVIVAYLHSMATAPKTSRTSALTGVAARGKAVVEGKGQCLSCHRIDAAGTVAGPDLSAIGSLRRASDLERSLLEPDAEIRPENLPVRATAKDGSKITGKLLNQDTYSIQILDSNAKLRSLDKSKMADWEVMKTSPMPSFKSKLTEQELADVVSYLVSLKGQGR